MRRGVGFGGINKQLLEKEKFSEKGSELAREHLEKLVKQFEIFRDNLEKFAEKHKNEIKKDVTFRRQFQDMSATVDVDPLAFLGLGDFYYELAVQIVEVYVATSVQNVNDQGCVLIQCIPDELIMNHTAILNLLQTRSSFTVKQLRDQFKWSDDRIQTAINFMIKEGLVWVDNNGRDTDYSLSRFIYCTMYYRWRTCLIMFIEFFFQFQMTEHQHTSDNRHHLAIWCRAEIFTLGVLTTPSDITPAINCFLKKLNYCDSFLFLS
ncbi:unnamed protein product [Rotaria sordida]|uniref:Vacuolar-sorting protein SNF8 n=1 Tax=Rotaria sordida TaxID=392033 RepID=A0A815I003_9BILA|nr:unnamed protein product [Rotaria sordida]CAF1420659.1 unnamed protein product [Rotaria sordida]CAF1605521.1 unnamed protein product [Rotaria sordida]CAF4088399.1 unnamed protein product [Rotaria sordida]